MINRLRGDFFAGYKVWVLVHNVALRRSSCQRHASWTTWVGQQYGCNDWCWWSCRCLPQLLAGLAPLPTSSNTTMRSLVFPFPTYPHLQWIKQPPKLPRHRYSRAPANKGKTRRTTTANKNKQGKQRHTNASSFLHNEATQGKKAKKKTCIAFLLLHFLPFLHAFVFYFFPCFLSEIMRNCGF